MNRCVAMKHLLILRSSLSYTDQKTYNSQEIGLAKDLCKKGYKVSVVLAGREECVETQDGCTVYYLRIRRLQQSIGYFVHLEDLFRKLKPDIVQVHDLGMFATYKAVRLSKKYNIPCVLIQGMYDETRKPFKRQLEQAFNLMFGRYVLANVDGVGCKTETAANYIKGYYGRVEPMITPVGLDVAKFKTPASRVETRRKYGLDRDDRLLLFVGNANMPVKHVDTLVGMMKSMPAGYKLMIVGNNSACGDLMEESGNNVIWTGKILQENIPDIYAVADLFVFPSEYEIYGMVMLEAMYFGVPVLTTRTAGGKALVTDGVTGYLIDGFSPDDWRQKVCKIFSEGGLYARMREYVPQYVREKLLWSKTGESFIRLYDKAMERHRDK